MNEILGKTKDEAGKMPDSVNCSNRKVTSSEESDCNKEYRVDIGIVNGLKSSEVANTTRSFKQSETLDFTPNTLEQVETTSAESKNCQISPSNVVHLDHNPPVIVQIKENQSVTEDSISAKNSPVENPSEKNFRTTEEAFEDKPAVIPKDSSLLMPQNQMNRQGRKSLAVEQPLIKKTDSDHGGNKIQFLEGISLMDNLEASEEKIGGKCQREAEVHHMSNQQVIDNDAVLCSFVSHKAKRRQIIWLSIFAVIAMGVAVALVPILFLGDESQDQGVAPHTAKQNTINLDDEADVENNETGRDIDTILEKTMIPLSTPTSTPIVVTKSPTTIPSEALTTLFPTFGPTSDGSTRSPSTNPTTTQPSTSDPSLSVAKEAILSILQNVLPDPSRLQDASSLQYQALEWLVSANAENEQQQDIVKRLADSDGVRINDAVTSKIIQRYTLALLDIAVRQKTDESSLIGNYGNLRKRSLQAEEKSGFANPNSDECSWYGITCSNTTLSSNITVAIVRKVVWADAGLTGSIPSEISMLSHIDYLDFAENSLSGEIPEELYDLMHLKDLFLHSNMLTGQLSSRIGQLSKLEKLYLGSNQLHGRIPQELGSPALGAANVRPLKYIILYNNSFSGNLPANLNLRKLYYLDLGFNELEGPIPEDWVYGANFMRDLREVYLSNNRLNGTLPDMFPEFGNARLEQIVINDNQFSGRYEFPVNYRNRNFLQNLQIHNNNFIGISGDVCNLIVFEGADLVNLKADCQACSCRYFCDDCVQ